MNFGRISNFLKMPKKFVPEAKKIAGASNSAANSGSKSASSSASNSAGPIFSHKSGGIAVKIHAKPGAKLSNVVGIDADAIEIQIGAAPRDGEANAELIEFLSKTLRIKRTEICLEIGAKSREKTIIISKNANLSPDDVKNLLKDAIE